ncbi:MAG: DUF5615 family PIN-like protein [Anaerolineales bacterium]|nr:DUF5615 family PIN-like protein [Anaerolineales bacterium]
MIKFVADEDFDNRILRGLLRRQSEVDLVRIQDTPLSGADDPTILEWAYQQQRILLTHDVSTMTHYAYKRITAGQTIAGLIEVPQSLSIGKAIEDLLTVMTCCSSEEFENQIQYLPL